MHPRPWQVRLEAAEIRGDYPRDPDLAVSAINVTANHEQRLVCVTADIVNLGGGPPGGPFCVTIQMLTYFDQVEATDQEFYWFPAHVALPLRTPFACMELRYADEGGDLYQIMAGVDVTNALVDPDRSNNFKYHFWWAFSPKFAPGAEPFRVETRIENGKRVTKKTLGGKPVR